jgi:EAL domain-containing protein (putative c-di-GMP-specific phosphodiesterase class I)
MSVNLSARQFRQENFVKLVTEILRETGLQAEHLEMELTESMLMHNANAAIAILEGLKSIGVRLSLDDFGTGYSSLSYLSRLPIDTLKIDRSFVQYIGDQDEHGNGILAQAIISLGHSLNLTVIAEGVETDAQLKFLKAHQCDEVQGFYFGEPTVPEEFAKMLAKKSCWGDS